MAFPAVGDPGTNTVAPPNDWGSKTLAALANGMDSNGNLVSANIKLGTNPASAGTIRLANAGWIAGRNATNSGDVNMFRVDASNRIETAAMLYRNDDGAAFGDTGAFLKLRRVSSNAPSSEITAVDIANTATGTATIGDRMNGIRVQIFDGVVANKTITNMTRVGTTVTVTANAHGFPNGHKVAIYGVVHTFNAEVNGAWTIANVAANTFEITVPGLSSGAYTNSGTVTNRPMYFGVVSYVVPSVARGGLTGTAVNGDDIACFVGGNAGTAKGTDCYYIARNAGIAGSEWTTCFTADCNADFGIRLNGTFASYGLDFYAGTFTGGMIRFKNNSPVVARNAADAADLELFRLTASNVLQFGNSGVLAQVDINSPTQFSWSVSWADNVHNTFGTTNGTKFGTATNQKIGFHNATPVAQRAGAAQAAVVTTASTQTTPWGFSTQAQADAIVTLVNELRAMVVEKGLMKGAA